MHDLPAPERPIRPRRYTLGRPYRWPATLVFIAVSPDDSDLVPGQQPPRRQLLSRRIPPRGIIPVQHRAKLVHEVVFQPVLRLVLGPLEGEPPQPQADLAV